MSAPAHWASAADLAALWRPLTPAEAARAEALLPVVEASLRSAAAQCGVDLDARCAKDADLALVAKSVTVDVTARALMTDTDAQPLTQFSQTAGVYSASGTYLVPGGGLFIKKSELARLGLRRQRMGVLEPYGKSD